MDKSLCMYILYIFSQYNYEKDIYYMVHISSNDLIFFSPLKRKHLKPSYLA